MSITSKELVDNFVTELDYFVDWRDDVISSYRLLNDTFGECGTDIDNVVFESITETGYSCLRRWAGSSSDAEVPVMELVYVNWPEGFELNDEFNDALVVWETYTQWRNGIENMVTDLLWIENSVRGFAHKVWDVEDEQ